MLRGGEETKKRRVIFLFQLAILLFPLRAADDGDLNLAFGALSSAKGLSVRGIRVERQPGKVGGRKKKLTHTTSHRTQTHSESSFSLFADGPDLPDLLLHHAGDEHVVVAIWVNRCALEVGRRARHRDPPVGNWLVCASCRRLEVAVVRIVCHIWLLSSAALTGALLRRVVIMIRRRAVEWQLANSSGCRGCLERSDVLWPSILKALLQIVLQLSVCCLEVTLDWRPLLHSRAYLERNFDVVGGEVGVVRCLTLEWDRWWGLLARGCSLASSWLMAWEVVLLRRVTDKRKMGKLGALSVDGVVRSLLWGERLALRCDEWLRVVLDAPRAVMVPTGADTADAVVLLGNVSKKVTARKCSWCVMSHIFLPFRSSSSFSSFS